MPIDPNQWSVTPDINQPLNPNEWNITPDPPEPQASSSFWDMFSSGNAARMGLSSLGDIAGGYAAAAFPPLAWATYPGISALGGGAGELAGQLLDDTPINPWMIGTEAVLNPLFPGPNIPGKGAALKEIGQYALGTGKAGAKQGFIGSFPRHVAATGEWELPGIGEIAGQTALGAGVGTALGGTIAGGARLLQGNPRITPGAGAENIDLGPPPPNLKQIGSGSTGAPPPPFEAAPPPPPGAGGTPMTSMDPSVDVSINDPARMAELKAQGYVFVGVNENNARFVRPDLMNTTQGEPTSPPIQDMRAESEFITVDQIRQEFGMAPVDARARGLIELFSDDNGRVGFRRTPQAEPPTMEEPPIESYDINNGETPFTEAQPSRVVQFPPTGEPIFRPGEGEPGINLNETFTQFLNRTRGINIDDFMMLPSHIRESYIAEYSTAQGREVPNFDNMPDRNDPMWTENQPTAFDPTTNDVGPSGPRGALEGFDTPVPPQTGQQELPFGPFGGTNMRGLPDDVDFLMRQMQNPSQRAPEGPLPQQLGLGIDPGGGKPRMTDMEASIDPTTGKRRPPISGGSDAFNPADFDHPDKIGRITDPKQADAVDQYWHDLSMKHYHAGDYVDAERYANLADLAKERYDHLIDTTPSSLPSGHTDVEGTRFIDLNQAIKRDTGPTIEARQRDIEARYQRDGYATDKYRLPDGNIVGVDATATKGAQTTDFTMKGGKVVKMEYIGPKQPNDSIDPGSGYIIENRTKSNDPNEILRMLGGEQSLGKTPQMRNIEDLAQEVSELLEKPDIPNPDNIPGITRENVDGPKLKSLIEEIRYKIQSATDTKTALRNLSDIRAHVDSATTARQKAIFENLYQDAFNVYHQTIRPAVQKGLDEDYPVTDEFQDEFSRSFADWERQQNTPYGRGQLDLPMGALKTGKVDVFESGSGQILRTFDSEAAAQDFIMHHPDRSGLDYDAHDPSFGYADRPRNELGQFISAMDAAKQQKLPLEPEFGWDTLPGGTGKKIPPVSGGSDEPPYVPPSQVPPGTRPPVPDEPPASVVVDKNKPPPTQSVWEQAYDAVRNLTTGLDISAPMRQGLPLIATKSWWTSWSTMLKAWGSQAAYDANLKSINDHYLFQSYTLPDGKKLKGFGQRMGLRIDEIADVEEVTASKWLEKHLPGIKQSNRAYNAYLKKLRADTFTNLIEDAKRLGLNPFADETLAREIAEFVNTASGAASIKMDVPEWMSKTREVSFERSAKQLSYLLFSPRQTFSRARMLNPLTYSHANPYVRQQYMRALFSSVGAWSTIAGAASLSGYADEVSLDPTSADFGKIRIGNTRLDAGGGFQQYMVAGARLLSGQRTTAASGGGRGNTQVLGEGYQARTGLDVAQMFLSNKLHPLTKFAYDMMSASEYQKFQVLDKTAQIAIPLYMQDAYEIIMQDRPEILPLLFPAAIGMGTQTYEAGEATSRIVPPEYDYSYTGGERPWSGLYR